MKQIVELQVKGLGSVDALAGYLQVVFSRCQVNCQNYSVQRVRDELISPVHAVQAYVCAAEFTDLNMNGEYLFRPLGNNKFSVSDGYWSYSQYMGELSSI